MPTYEYHCTACGHKLEEMQKITSSPITKCPKCGKDSLRRGPGGGIGLSFKGSGFYINDYKPESKQNSSCETKTKGDVNPPAESKSNCCPCGKTQNSCDS